MTYGYVEALNIRTEHITIRSGKIPKAIQRLRIAQIADIHLGLIVGPSRLKRIIEPVSDANPDILVSTGDLVDGQMDNPKKLTKMFRDINPRYGKFAVTGNHELYAGLGRALAFTEQAGFTVLRGESVTVADFFTIAGMDDPARGVPGANRSRSEKAVLEQCTRDQFTLLLKHQPIVSNKSIGMFDLQLSGHTHKGQIFPFNLISKLFYPFTLPNRVF